MKKTNSKAYRAGISIGLAAAISFRITNNYLAALLFSVGLLGIRISGYDLFTGKIQLLVGKRITPSELLKILFWNAAGVLSVLIVVVLFLFDEAAWAQYEVALAAKWSHNFLYYVGSGACCGALMTYATKKETPLWVSTLCVMAFILGGFNHCIADMFYVNNGAILSWFGVVIGNILGGLLFAA